MPSDATGVTGLAGRYAAALFELAEESGALDGVADDLNQLQAMIRASDDLRRLIASPILKRTDQRFGMDAVMAEAGMDKLTRNFVAVVAENRRLYAVPDMIKAFQARLAAKRGETTAEVVSAKPLTETQLTQLGDALKRAIGTKVAIDAKVDAGLLGGLVVKVGSRMVDSSLNTKLQQLRLAMKGVA